MANESFEIRIEGDDAITAGRLWDQEKAIHLVRKALDDMADAVEKEARRRAPKEHGELKAHPVDRDETRVSISPGVFDVGFGQATGIPTFGGGTAVRGPGGRFISPSRFRSPVFIPDEVVGRATLSIPEEPKHAIWVHNGTGIYGPLKRPITARVPGNFMVFGTWSKAIDRRKKWKLRVVKGQKPQPYLTEAYLLIQGTYIPARIELLRAQIAAET